jgi:hypothetical protein
MSAHISSKTKTSTHIWVKEITMRQQQYQVNNPWTNLTYYLEWLQLRTSIYARKGAKQMFTTPNNWRRNTTSDCGNGFTLPQKAERAPSSNKWSFSGKWQLSPSADSVKNIFLVNISTRFERKLHEKFQATSCASSSQARIDTRRHRFNQLPIMSKNKFTKIWSKLNEKTKQKICLSFDHIFRSNWKTWSCCQHALHSHQLAAQL